MTTLEKRGLLLHMRHTHTVHMHILGTLSHHGLPGVAPLTDKAWPLLLSENLNELFCHFERLETFFLQRSIHVHFTTAAGECCLRLFKYSVQHSSI